MVIAPNMDQDSDLIAGGRPGSSARNQSLGGADVISTVPKPPRAQSDP
jgi:hypothetical protein